MAPKSIGCIFNKSNTKLKSSNEASSETNIDINDSDYIIYNIGRNLAYIETKRGYWVKIVVLAFLRN